MDTSPDKCGERPLDGSQWGVPDFAVCELPSGHDGLHDARWTTVDDEGTVVEHTHHFDNLPPSPTDGFQEVDDA